MPMLGVQVIYYQGLGISDPDRSAKRSFAVLVFVECAKFEMHVRLSVVIDHDFDCLPEIVLDAQIIGQLFEYLF